MFDNLWVEKYRPKTLSECILTQELRDKVEEWRAKKEIPNILFAGNAGGGKTSLAKIIVTEILDCQYLYINASDENGIDIIRHKITNFAQTRSIDGKIKIVLLDEADGLTPDAQRALRNTMEEFAENVRFILTCNLKYRVIGPIQSRVQTFEVVPPLAGCVERVKHILTTEGISAAADQGPKLRQLIQNSYPDMRAVINNLSKNVIGKTLNVVFISNSFKFAEGVVAQMATQPDPTDIRKYLTENESEFNKDYPGLLRSMFNAVDKSQLTAAVKRKYMLILAEGMYRCAFVMDQEINAYATLIALTEVK